MTPIQELEEELAALERELNAGPHRDLRRYEQLCARRNLLHDRCRQRPAVAWDSWVPPRFADAALDPAIPAHQAAAEWVAAGMDGNLLVLGPTGVGKTRAAYGALRKASEVYGLVPGRPGPVPTWEVPTGRQRIDIAGGSVVDVLEFLRPPDGIDVAQLVAPQLLLLDDLGTEKPTDWTAEQMYAVVNGRWNARRSIVATSNLGSDGLRGVLGERVYDRLRDEATVITMKGASRRKPRPAPDTHQERTSGS